MQNARLDEAQAEIKTARRNINNFSYADYATLMVESKEELKSLLMKVKEENEKAALKLNIPKLRSWLLVHHFMANRWGSNGKSVRLPLAPKSLWTVTAAMNLKDTHPLEEKQCQTLTAY